MRVLAEAARAGASGMLLTMEQWSQQQGATAHLQQDGVAAAPGGSSVFVGATSGFLGLFSNSPLWIAVLSFVVAQLLKFFINFYETSSWQYERLVGSGGMPSAHSAFVTGLATAVAIRDGTGSSVFAIALVFALVIMYDATNLRMACGRHAQALNAIMADLPSDHPVAPGQFGKLRESLGHTPLQVAVGAVLGFLLALLIQGLLGPGS